MGKSINRFKQKLLITIPKMKITSIMWIQHCNLQIWNIKMTSYNKVMTMLYNYHKHELTYFGYFKHHWSNSHTMLSNNSHHEHKQSIDLLNYMFSFQTCNLLTIANFFFTNYISSIHLWRLVKSCTFLIVCSHSRNT